jgi:hypothetical protein
MNRFGEVLTFDEKERIKALFCAFVDELGGDDILIIDGKTEFNTFSGKTIEKMFVSGEKKLGVANE